MSEQIKHIQHKKEIRNRIANTLLAAALGGIVGGAVDHGLNEQPAAVGVSTQEVEKIIQNEVAKKDFADREAATLTAALNGPAAKAKLQILNGEVQIKVPGVRSTPNVLHDPIVLYGAEDPKLAAHPNSQTLDDEWLGLTSTDATGRVVVTPFLFKHDSNTTYVSHNETAPTLSVSAYTQTTGKGEDTTAFVYAFDEQMQQTLNNPDGTPLIVGYTEGMK